MSLPPWFIRAMLSFYSSRLCQNCEESDALQSEYAFADVVSLKIGAKSMETEPSDL